MEFDRHFHVSLPAINVHSSRPGTTGGGVFRRRTMTSTGRSLSILLQTTIPFAKNDWHIGRFSLLAEHLRRCGHKVDCRDRAPTRDGDDDVLSGLANTSYHEVWLFGADAGNGLSPRD